MPRPVDLSFMDMDDAQEDPSALLDALPEIRQEVGAMPADDDLGLRSLLERPEAFAHAWWRDQAGRSGSMGRSTPRSSP